MSGKVGGNNGGKGDIGLSGIPASSRKMVQSLKEIVDNYTEQEIYATLKECNMDPNEAVGRLLSQDPFHEVKSKREKKKENKDTTEPRSRGLSNTSNRGGRGSMDRYAGRGGSNQFSTSESGISYGKLQSRKENGTHSYGGSSIYASGQVGNNTNWQSPSNSDAVAMENKSPMLGSSGGVISSSQPSSGYQPAWFGAAGQVSMADIVKMGRPQGKANVQQKPPAINNVDHHRNGVPVSVASHGSFHSSKHNASKVSDIHSEPGLTRQDIPPNDEWPLIEPLPSSTTSAFKMSPAEIELYSDSSNMPQDGANQQINAGLDVVQGLGDGPVETINANHVEPASVSGINRQEDDSGGASTFDDHLYEEPSNYEPYIPNFKQNEAEDGVSSVSANLQQLSLQEDDQGTLPEEDSPSVVIPDHLQLHTPDCFHLSFGSFGSDTGGTGATFPGSSSFPSRPLESNIEEASVVANVSSSGNSDARNAEYYEDEHLGSTSDGNVIQRTDAAAGNYDTPVSQAEGLKQEAPKNDQLNEYAFPSSTAAFSYESNQQPNIAFTHQHESSQQNPAPFSTVMQAYTNSLPNNLLSSTVQTGREDLPYSTFRITQSMPTNYNNNTSSVSGPTMPEALRTSSNNSTSLPTPQALPGAAVASGPALPQHLSVHPYSQPSLPLGHFANMIGYPLLPQSYAYMPSAFQQAFAGSSTYHQSLAAVLPQYKSSVSASSLPQSAAIAASGYGFGNSSNFPGGNFPLNNPPTAPMGTTIGYDDLLNSQFKDSNHLISVPQNENSAMWVHGPGSRTMSAVPASTYYSFQGQNQQASGGFRQGQQQPSQQFGGALGYPNFYHSQTGISLENQQQNLRDASLGGSQGQQPKQSQQIWQNNY